MGKKLVLIFAAALIIRIVFSFSAHHGDLNNNISWGDLLVARGATNFYESKPWPYSAPNQPPLYLLLYGLVSLTWRGIDKLGWWLNNNIGIFPSAWVWFWEGQGMLFLVKLPSILADLGIGYLIYRYFRKMDKEKLGIGLAAIWLFNPLSFYNSAVWGQTDPIVNLLGLGSIFLILNRKLVQSSFLLTLSILFKSSLIIFVPVLILLALAQKHRWQKWLEAGLVALLTVFLVSFWFRPSLDLPLWLYNLYTLRILPGEIGDLTANAFNFWWLVNPGKVLDNMVFSGIPFRIWGFIIFGISYVGALGYLVKAKFKPKVFWLTLAVIVLTSFLFLTRMHERYLYPFFPLATIIIGLIPELITVYIIYSLTFLLNMYHLFWVPSVPWLEHNFDLIQIGSYLAGINLVLFGYFIFRIYFMKIRL